MDSAARKISAKNEESKVEELTKEGQFLKDVEDHKVEILLDNGIYRHLKASDNGSSIMHFHITTWPGYLCISGDMGCHVFSRLSDMFQFFRRGSGDISAINPGYWAEKVQAADRDGVEEFSFEKFKSKLLEYIDDSAEENALTESEKAALLEAFEDEVLSADDCEVRARDAADNFEHEGFRFYDLWEYNFSEYTDRYLWSCYAIVWAIAQYDSMKEQESKL